MQRGKKQSPFIGKRVPLVDESGAPILYQRYKHVSEIVAGRAGAAPAGKRKRSAADGGGVDAAAAANGMEEQQQQASKKKSKKAAAAEAEPPAAAGEAPVEAEGEEDEARALQLRREEKARKKRERQARRAAELAAEAAAAGGAAGGGRQEDGHGEGAGGGEGRQQQEEEGKEEEDRGNAEEAARMRQVLGFTSAGTAAAAAPPPPRQQQPAAAAPARQAPPPSSFAFNFAPRGQLDALPAAERVAAQTEAKLAAIAAVDSADKDGLVPRRVFVGGMPYGYSREQVAEYWGWCGEIESLDMLTFPDSGRFRGIAFITFASQEAADTAVGYDGEQLEGQTLKVERCKAAAAAKQVRAAALAGRGAPRQPPRSQQQQPQPQQSQQPQPHHQGQADGGRGQQAGGGPARTPGYNVAYCGNVAFEAGPDELSELFADCGVTKVRLHTDKATGKSKGYAHVHFADEQGLDRALALSGTELHGRPIKVSYGQPKKG